MNKTVIYNIGQMKLEVDYEDGQVVSAAFAEELLNKDALETLHKALNEVYGVAKINLGPQPRGGQTKTFDAYTINNQAYEEPSNTKGFTDPD